MSARLRILKGAWGGDLCGNTLTCPTIGHSAKDRGTSITERSGAPGDLLVFVHNGTPADALAAKDRALELLGEEPRFEQRCRDRDDPIASMQRRVQRRVAEEQLRADAATRQLRAGRIWNAGRDPRGTIVERYLRSRALDLPDDIAGTVLRFVERCPFGSGTTMPAMVAAMRCVRTGRFKAIHRTALTPDGRKIDRKMLGSVFETAVMLDAFENVTTGIAAGEGIESCLSARQMGIRPTWALCSTSMIAHLPVLPGVESLTLLIENDANGASDRACTKAALRWHGADRAVDFVRPARAFKDLNDSLMGGAAA